MTLQRPYQKTFIRLEETRVFKLQFLLLPQLVLAKTEPLLDPTGVELGEVI